MKPLFCLLLGSSALCSTIFVPLDFPTIQDAINAAADGDSILVLPGTWEGFDYQGRSVHVGSMDGPESTQLISGVTIANGEGPGTVLEGFTFTMEVLPSGSAMPALLVDGTSPTITGNIFQGIEAVSYATGGIVHGVVARLLDSSALLENNTFVDNYLWWDSAPLDRPGMHGAITSGPKDSYINGFCVYANSSGDSAIVLRNNSFCSNTVTGFGIHLYGLALYCAGNVILQNDLFYENGCTINTFFPSTGNAIYMSGSSTVLIENCVVSHNYLSGSSSCEGISIPNYASCTVMNTIIWDDSIRDDSGSAVISYSDVQGGWPGTGNIDQDPLFVAGPLSGFHLDPGNSPCIDAGNPSPLYFDPEDPENPGQAMWPALGGLRNDMGIYGGGGGNSVGISRPPSQDCGRPSISTSPEPFSDYTTVTFNLPEPGHATVIACDLSGRCVSTVADGEFGAGPHSVVFFADGLPAGVYLCRLQTGESSGTARIVLIR